jgi:hypothetical protein
MDPIVALEPGLPASLTGTLDPLRHTPARAEAGATRWVIQQEVFPPRPASIVATGVKGTRFAGAWQGLSKSSLRVIPWVLAGGDRVAPTGAGRRNPDRV